MDTSSSTKKRHRSDDEDLTPSNKKKSTTSSTTNLLQDIPTSQHYQVSYMHQQTITHVTTSIKHGMVITGSVDGVVKFWKRTSSTAANNNTNSSSSSGGAASTMDKSNKQQSTKCLEFVKSYTSHIGPLLSLITSQPNGDTAVSIGYDNIIKFYDVATFDVSGMIRTNVATTNNNGGSSSRGGGNKKFRLGKHAVLIEREDVYLLVSTRAPNREEWSMEEVQREREKEQRLKQQQQQQDDSDDDGPLPQGASNNETTKKEEQKKEDNMMVPPGSILLFSGTNLSSNPLLIISYHVTPVTSIAYHSTKQWLVSGDVSGVLEVWNLPSISSSGGGEDNTTSSNGLLLPFESKLSTDLYALIKKKTYAIDIAISESTKGSNNNNGHFAIYSSDRKIRLFSFNDCKLVCIYDERLKVYDKLLSSSSSSSSSMGIDAIEYGKRAALEREMEDAYLLSGGVSINPVTKQSLSNVTPSSEGTYHQSIHISFDNTGKYLLLPTIVGIKVINIVTHRVVATIGKGDASALRFITVVLCPGDAKVNQQMQLARMGGSSAAIKHGENENDVPNDSLLVALAYGKRRFYTFSHYDPLVNDQGEEEVDEQVILARDVLNEAPDASDLLEASHLGGRGNADADVETTLTTASKAILRTTHGDITIKLFPKETPKTIQNFIGHAQSGYYDNVIFHRIIQGFMLQTGDPLGDGTGGESIWGGEFEDEIRRDLRHDRPFTVSMANAGPNTNGSQFFITTVPTPWLDNKHTVFGRVTAGMEVVMAIEGVETDDLDRPLSEVKILSVDVS